MPPEINGGQCPASFRWAILAVQVESQQKSSDKGPITPERVLRKINEARFFLKKMVDNSEHAEVHREAVGIVLELGAARKPGRPDFIFPSARFKSRSEGRFQGRFKPSRLGASPASSVYQQVYRDTWHSRDYPPEVIDTCRDSLNMLAGQVYKWIGP